MKFLIAVSFVGCFFASVEAQTLPPSVTLPPGVTLLPPGATLPPVPTAIPSYATIKLDCAVTDDAACGTAANPCKITLHADEGFVKDDVVTVAYGVAPFASTHCSGDKCEVYAKTNVYYQVGDLHTDKGIAKMGFTAFMAICDAPCGNYDLMSKEDYFSGPCQKTEADCTLPVTACSTGDEKVPSNPDGAITFAWPYTPHGSAYGLAPGFATLATLPVLAIMA